ncbi:hypothetical protein [Nocardia sp. NPDC051750]|uniref:hypothetical protein n=1 Tax=Nocardia sp. NPDC051750 TaxID=3364325 RepID=UPI00378B186C
MQCDLWFPPADFLLGFGQVGRPPVLVMVTGYSRVLTAVTIPTRQSLDLLAGHWALTSGWARVPKMLVGDNEAAVGRWRGGKPQLTETMNAFRGSLGIKVLQCRLRDPEAKGLVERANGYLETSFSAGPGVRRAGGFQCPAHLLAGSSQPPSSSSAGLLSGGSVGRPAAKPSVHQPDPQPELSHYPRPAVPFSWECYRNLDLSPSVGGSRPRDLLSG